MLVRLGDSSATVVSCVASFCFSSVSNIVFSLGFPVASGVAFLVVSSLSLISFFLSFCFFCRLVHFFCRFLGLLPLRFCCRLVSRHLGHFVGSLLGHLVSSLLSRLGGRFSRSLLLLFFFFFVRSVVFLATSSFYLFVFLTFFFLYSVS